MKEINSTEFKNRFGECLDMAMDEPVAVSKSGKAIAVVMSAEEYGHLQRLDDAYWIARAEAAEATGEWLGPEETMRVLTDRLKRQ
jgi:prevent-host-death family protein